jgi:hypothetical protein
MDAYIRPRRQFTGAAGYGILHAAVAMLPLLAILPVGGILAGSITAKTGDFRIIFPFACIVLTAGMGSLVSLGPFSSVALQSGLQVCLAIGIGIIVGNTRVTTRVAYAYAKCMT